MSEITKLYENAGITKIGNRKCAPTEFLDCQNYCWVIWEKYFFGECTLRWI